ncbi:MAG: hypothetical protein PF487_13290 [Bacteroidales bacterium]|jgi:hypothetical protein|nr:hypothetical protein [Bacteroidales bacterium]
MYVNFYEKKCIDYSLKIREQIILNELTNLKEKKLPLILTPKRYIKFFFSDSSLKGMSILKIILVFLLLVTLYFIAIPIVFIFRLPEVIGGDKKRKQQVREIKYKYEIGYDISNNKSFNQLWDYKGLRNWGMSHMHLSGITQKQQLDCIYYWFNILYGKDRSELDELCKIIQERIKKIISDYYKENPKGHIIPSKVHQHLPDEIDKKYGNYLQYQKQPFEDLNDEVVVSNFNENVRNEYEKLESKYMDLKLFEAKNLLVDFIEEYPIFIDDRFYINIGQYDEDELANPVDFLYIEVIHPNRFKTKFIPPKFNEYRVLTCSHKLHEKINSLNDS